MPTINYDNFVSLSGFSHDKIVQQGTVAEGTEVTIANPGQSSGSTANFAKYNIVQSTVDNNYGKPVFVRYRWSVDGGATWQGAKSSFPMTFDLAGTQDTTAPDKRVSVGSDSDFIYFRTASNGHDGDEWDGVGQSWNNSPQSTTFIIEYWAYELD